MARLTNGREIYPHRPDLRNLPFWICDTCKNYVGCHHKTKDRTRPLGAIPTKEVRKGRNEIHKLLDPVWLSAPKHLIGRTRRKLYGKISEILGYEYHTAELIDMNEIEKVKNIVKNMCGYND